MKYLGGIVILAFVGALLGQCAYLAEAQVKAPIEADDPAKKKEYLCGLAAFLNCQFKQKNCISPLNNSERWTEAVHCNKTLANCFSTAIEDCSNEFDIFPIIPSQKDHGMPNVM